MKAIFIGGTHHKHSQDIQHANPVLKSKQGEPYKLSGVKNLHGEIYAVYKSDDALQVQVIEVENLFNNNVKN